MKENKDIKNAKCDSGSLAQLRHLHFRSASEACICICIYIRRPPRRTHNLCFWRCVVAFPLTTTHQITYASTDERTLGFYSIQISVYS